jgi:UDP-N-acetyl-D-glucosamine dehydrogenase
MNTQTIPKLVGGIDPASTDVATALYRKAIKQVIPVSSAEVAESASCWRTSIARSTSRW